MAELINEIISPEAFKQVADMKAELASLTKQMENLLKTINASSSTTQNSGLAGVTQQTQQYNEDAKQLAKIQKEIAVAVARLNALRKDEGVQLAEAKEKLRQHTAELKNNARETLAADGSLDQMRANLNRLEKAYTALSAVAREGTIGKNIFAEMTKAREGVTLLEQSMGNYKRNVGNYTNATFQLTQVLREMPAFAYSAQTGIMAISNNLPMLADGFKQVREQTGSTLKALAIFGRSLFSFANLFSIAIGFVSLFSKEIMGLFKSTSLAQEALDALSEGLKSGGLDTAISDYYRLTQSVDLVNKGLMSQKQALDLYNSTMGETTGELKSWDEAEQMILNNGGKYLQGLQLKTEALALYNESAKKAVELEMLQQNPDLSFFEKIKAFGMIFTPDFFKGYLNIGQSFADAQKALFGQKLNELEDQRKSLREEGNRLLTEYYKIDLEVDKIEKGGGKGRKPKKQASKERVEQVKQEKFDEFQMTLQLLEEYNQRELLVIQKQLSDKAITEEEYQLLVSKRQIQYINEQITAYRDYSKATEKLEIDRLKNIEDYNRKAVKENLDIVKGNLDSLQNIWDKADEDRRREIEKQISYIEILGASLNGLQDVYSAIADAEMQRFDLRQKQMEDYYDLENEKLNQLTLSDNERAKRKSELDAKQRAEQKRIDAERLQASRKQAQVDKTLAIAQIIAQTAIAIMTALTPPNPSIARSIIAGITGAAQLAKVIATPLPQFAKGTDNAPEGFAVVGERGTELVVNPDGTSWLTPAKDTITYLKKGAKVVPNNELMDMVKYANYVNVGGIKQGETGGLFGMALVSKFDELADKVDGLTRIMAGKNMSVNIQGNYDHYLHVRKNIR